MFRYSGRYGAGRTRMQWASGLVVLLFVALFARPVVAQTAQAAPAKAARTLLVMGDSLSAAYGLSPAQGWVALTADRIGKTRPGWRVVNASISGETTAGALARLPALLRKHQPSVLVVELGGNDALRGLAPAQLRGNLEKILLAADQAGARVLLLGIDVPPNYGPAYRERIRRSYAELATAHQAGLVPFFLEGVALQPGLMQADGLHPTAAAQPRLLDTVWPVLEPLL